MGLLSAPSILVKKPKPDPGCSADYPYLQQLELVERDGVEVRLTSFVAAGNNWSDQISDWFGSLRLSPFGSLHANICWQLDTAPDTFHYEVDGVDSKGNKITTALDVPIKVAGQPPGKFSLSETSIVLGVKAAESASATINVDLPATEAWTVTVLPANSKTTWLTTSPQSGRGPGQIKLIASGAGLAKGAYTATLLVESTYCVPSFITVPVTFLVGPSASTTITAVQNAASFAQAFAPGMLMSVYGTHLAAHTLAASSSPLPLSLDGVSATVNGIPAPIWFVSPGQVNLQIPYEVAAGKALVTVNNGGEVGVYPFLVSATAPGIFNNSGMLTPEGSGARGSTVSLYLTGDGELNPMIDTGAPPPASTPSNQLPKPRAKVEVTVGGVPAKVDFVGNPWLVGVTQINFTVPSNAALGRQPVVVTVGGQASAAETLIVR